MPLCLSVSLSLCLCLSVSLCRCVSVSVSVLRARGHGLLRAPPIAWQPSLGRQGTSAASGREQANPACHDDLQRGYCLLEDTRQKMSKMPGKALAHGERKEVGRSRVQVDMDMRAWALGPTKRGVSRIMSH